MKNLLLLILGINLIFQVSVLAETRVVKTIKDVALPSNYESNMYSNDLANVEEFLYGRSYTKDSLAIRFDRIEKTLFNRYYADLAPSQRMNNIIANYRKNYSNYSADYYPQTRVTPAQRFLNRFIGQPTGFTPPIMNLPFNDYGMPYGVINKGYYNNRGGYSYSNETPASAGFGVHILD